MNKNFSIVLVLLLTVLPAVYLCGKSINAFAKLEENGGVVTAYEQFASQVESDVLTNQEVAKRLRSIAKSEEKEATGFGLLKLSYCYWVVVFFFIAIFQGLIIHRLLKANQN